MMRVALALIALCLATAPHANAKPTICDQLSAASSVEDVWNIFVEHGAQKVADTAHESCPEHGLKIIAALKAFE
jgi:hypothetical protein